MNTFQLCQKVIVRKEKKERTEKRKKIMVLFIWDDYENFFFFRWVLLFTDGKGNLKK